MTKKAKIKIISWTGDPIYLMAYARRVMHSPIPDSLEEFKKNTKEYLGTDIDTYYKQVLLKDGMPTFLEYVHYVIKLENVSRALQTQLIRHRIGFSFSIQSLRCVDLPNFATDKAYYNPFGVNSLEYADYHDLMLKAEKNYQAALYKNVPTQDARGLLPMNIFSTITFSCSLRALIGMVNKRLCCKTQQEFHIVAKRIVKEVCKKDGRLASFFHKPCNKGRCMMESENEQQLAEKKLTGKQNTDHVCPVYMQREYGN